MAGMGAGVWCYDTEKSEKTEMTEKTETETTEKTMDTTWDMADSDGPWYVESKAEKS
jgi:hypothetical protein